MEKARRILLGRRPPVSDGGGRRPWYGPERSHHDIHAHLILGRGVVGGELGAICSAPPQGGVTAVALTNLTHTTHLDLGAEGLIKLLVASASTTTLFSGLLPGFRQPGPGRTCRRSSFERQTACSRPPRKGQQQTKLHAHDRQFSRTKAVCLCTGVQGLYKQP